MKILFLTSRFPYPPHRGDKLKIYHLLRQLSQQHDITLLSFIASNDERAYLGEIGKFCRRVEVVLLPAWKSALNCGWRMLSNEPSQVSYFRSAEMRATLTSLLEKEAFDMLYVHLIRMAQYADELRDIPRLLDLTDAGSLYLKRFRETSRSPLMRLLLGIEGRRLERYESILNTFDQCLVCSDVDRRFLADHVAGANIGLLHNGIDLEYFSSDSEPKRIPGRMIFTGNMSYFPNADGARFFISEIFPHVRRAWPSASLDIVGQNPGRNVRNLAASTVRVTGFVPDIREYYLRSSLAVAPIRFGAGTLNKVLEPMALGIPVVTTPIGVEGLPLHHDEHVLIAHSASDFATQIVRLLNDPDLGRRIAQNAQALVRSQYSWTTIGSTLESYCLKLTRNS